MAWGVRPDLGEWDEENLKEGDKFFYTNLIFQIYVDQI